MLLEADQRLTQTGLEGAVAGAFLGGAIGLLSHGTKGAAIGAAIGGIGGGLTAYAIALDKYKRDRSEANLRRAIEAANADAEVFEHSAKASETVAADLLRKQAEARPLRQASAISAIEYGATFYSFAGSSDIIHRHLAVMAASIESLKAGLVFFHQYEFQSVAYRIGAARRKELLASETIDKALSECHASDTPAQGADCPPAAREHDAGRSAEQESSARTARTNTTLGAAGPVAEQRELSPLFPWPPPTASAWFVVPNDLIVSPEASAPTLYTASERLQAALAAAGYSQTGFYSVPGGFAIVSDMERIYDDLTPIYSDRWRPIDRARDWTLSSYLLGLVYADPGRFRIIAFIVTDHPFSPSGEAITPAIAKRWASQGVNVLPPSLGEVPFDVRTYHCTSLVYEFRAQREMQPAFVRRSREPGKVHLERARIWSALQAADGDR